MRAYPETSRRSSLLVGLIALAVFIAGVDVGTMAAEGEFTRTTAALARAGRQATKAVAKGASWLPVHYGEGERVASALDEATSRGIYLVFRPGRPPCARPRRSCAAAPRALF